MMDFQLRTYAFIDCMQPQAAAHVASTCQGDVPIAGMSELFIEVAPGNEIFRCADIALKAADVRPALQIVEREFGLLEIHSRTPAEVKAAGEAVLDILASRRGPPAAEDRLHAIRHQRQPLSGATHQQVAQGQSAAAAIEPVRARSDAGGLCDAGGQRGGEGGQD